MSIICDNKINEGFPQLPSSESLSEKRLFIFISVWNLDLLALCNLESIFKEWLWWIYSGALPLAKKIQPYSDLLIYTLPSMFVSLSSSVSEVKYFLVHEIPGCNFQWQKCQEFLSHINKIQTKYKNTQHWTKDKSMTLNLYCTSRYSSCCYICF